MMLRQAQHRVDTGAIRERVPIEDAALRLGLQLRRKGRDLVGLCPFHDEKTPSFKLSNAKRFYHCFGCGAHGDVVALTMRILRLDFAETIARLADEAGLADPAVARQAAERARLAARRQGEEEARRRRERLDDARSIWRASGPAVGTVVEAYLRSRAIEPAAIGGVPPTMRFAAAAWHGQSEQTLPCLVTAIQGVDGRLVAMHQTWLAADGNGKARVDPAKIIRGPYLTGAARLTPARPRLLVGEGIETVLSALMAARQAGDDELGAWAALSLGNLAGAGEGRWERHPDFPGERQRRLPPAVPDMARPGIRLPPEVREVVILADADNKDPRAYERQLACAATRFQREGRSVRVARPPEGMDFNDVLLAARAA